jgi:hypothetical protein
MSTPAISDRLLRLPASDRVCVRCSHSAAIFAVSVREMSITAAGVAFGVVGIGVENEESRGNRSLHRAMQCDA